MTMIVINTVGSATHDTPQRSDVQLSWRIADNRADRPILRSDSPGSLRRGASSVHPHVPRARLRVPRRDQVPAKLRWISKRTWPPPVPPRSVPHRLPHDHHITIITIITIISGQSPTVSHMSIYSGPSLADCTAPPAPPSRLPTLEARRVDVVRSGGRTVGASVAIEIFIIDIVYRWVSASSLRRSLGNSPGAVCLVPRRMASLPAQ